MKKSKFIRIYITFLIVCLVPGGCKNKAIHAQIPEECHGNKRQYSVKLEDGKYKVDDALVYNNQNLNCLLSEIDTAELRQSDKKTDIPYAMKVFLDSLSLGEFRIADPNEEYQSGCIAFHNLPVRKLIYLGLSSDYVLMSYYSGGFASNIHVMIVKLKGNKVIDFWCGYSWVEQADKSAIMEKVQEMKKKEWGVNTNILTF